MSDLLSANRLATRWRTLLALVLGVVSVGVIGMHLLSFSHQLATSEKSGDQHQHTSAPAGAEAPPHDHAAEVVATGADVDAIATLNTSGAATGNLVHAVIGAVTGAVQHVGDSQDDRCSLGCGHAGMIVGSCLLAFSFGVLWRLYAPPAARAMCGAGLAALRLELGPVSTGGAVRRLALTHRELSISRT